jgi:hypothetical protein
MEQLEPTVAEAFAAETDVEKMAEMLVHFSTEILDRFSDDWVIMHRTIHPGNRS